MRRHAGGRTQVSARSLEASVERADSSRPRRNIRSAKSGPPLPTPRAECTHEQSPGRIVSLRSSSFVLAAARAGLRWATVLDMILLKMEKNFNPETCRFLAAAHLCMAAATARRSRPARPFRTRQIREWEARDCLAGWLDPRPGPAFGGLRLGRQRPAECVN
jgi:hypothetical protein